MKAIVKYGVNYIATWGKVYKMKVNFFMIILLTLTLPNIANSAVFGASVNYWTNLSNNTSITTADFNNDNNIDMAVINFDSNMINVFLGTGTGSFGAAVSYSTLGTSSISISSGDYNGDSIVDLAIANTSTNDVSILLGFGDGTFGTATKFGTLSSPTFIMSADFNNDNVLDLAVLSSGSGSVSLLLGVGDGTFPPAINSLAGALSTSLAAADLNGDGNIDLVGTNSTNDISVLLGNGNGTFLAAVNYAVGTLPSSVIIKDFNTDGNLDIAVANKNSDNISILMGVGGGNFATSVNYSTVAPSQIIKGGVGYGGRPTSIVSADFNRDGYSDIAVSNYGTSFGSWDVALLKGIGDGTFSTAESYNNIGMAPQFIDTADFNGDGYMDLVTANRRSSNVSVFLNQSAPSNPSTPPLQTPVTESPSSVAPAASTTGGAGGCLLSLNGYSSGFLLWIGIFISAMLVVRRKSDS